MADEATGNLDPANTAKVMDSLFAAAASRGTTLVTVTHEHDLLDRFDRVVDFKTIRTCAKRRDVVKDVLYLAWRYLAYNRGKTAVLVASIMLVVYLPLTLRVLVARSAAELTLRAEATPLLAGAKGSALELVLNALYFESAPPETTPYAESLRIEESGLARAIPLYAGFHARGHPIIGTTSRVLRFPWAEL